MKNIILIAPPAAGKGTISKYLVEKYNYIHLSTGDLLRKEISLGTDTGLQIKELMETGKLTPDSIMLPLFEKELEKIKDKHFILDGSPRTLYQAEHLTEVFSKINVDNYVVINLSADKEVLEKRIVGRRYCTNCGSSYNVYFEKFKPIKENICDKCNNDLIIRTDDNLTSFQNRYEDYIKETEPLISYYKEKGLLEVVDANLPNEEIVKTVEEIIGW